MTIISAVPSAASFAEGRNVSLPFTLVKEDIRGSRHPQSGDFPYAERLRPAWRWLWHARPFPETRPLPACSRSRRVVSCFRKWTSMPKSSSCGRSLSAFAKPPFWGCRDPRISSFTSVKGRGSLSSVLWSLLIFKKESCRLEASIWRQNVVVLEGKDT